MHILEHQLNQEQFQHNQLEEDRIISILFSKRNRELLSPSSNTTSPNSRWKDVNNKEQKQQYNPYKQFSHTH